MPKRIIPKDSTGPAPDADFVIADRSPSPAFMRRQGLGARDMALLNKYADALAGVRDGLVAGDEAAVRQHLPALQRLALDADRIRQIARKGISTRRVAVV